MMRLATNVLGSFVLDGNRVVRQKRFSDGVKEIAAKLSETENSVCSEERELLKWLSDTGNKKVFVKNPSRFQGKGLKIAFTEDKERVDLYRICDEIGYDSSKLNELINKVNRMLTREKLKVIEKDQLLIQAVDSLDDIDEAGNRLIERLREWHSLHFPELDYLVEDHETYSKMVSELGDRSNFTESKLSIEPGFAKKIAKAAEDSTGVNYTEEDMKAVRHLASDILKLFQTKKDNEAYLTALMHDVAPNINALTGPVLGARIISLAGSLRKLSIMPAGTIQILGAEDAFFKFLKTKKKPPKHGIIFQLPEIRGAPKKLRGKISRTFAAKVALASRSDYYKGEFFGDRLKKEFDARVNSLK